MSFSLLFPDSKKWRLVKRMALKAVVDDSFEQEKRFLGKYEFLRDESQENKNYLIIKENYKKVKAQLELGKIHDFYRFKKKFRRNVYPPSKFNRFKLVSILKDCEPYYIFREGRYEKVIDRVVCKTCPFCNLSIPEEEIAEHLKTELYNEKGDAGTNQVTVVFDKGIRTEYDKLTLDCKDVRTLKKLIYDRTGVSTSKQDIYRGEILLKNTDCLDNETVLVRQRRREQKK